MRFGWIFAFFLIACSARCEELTAEKTVIPLEIDAPDELCGGLIAADVDDDEVFDLLLTRPDYLGAYTVDGQRLWSRRVTIQLTGRAEDDGLPGLHAPGVQAGDIDGDGHTEIVYLDRDNTLHVLRGATGRTLWTRRLTCPSGAQRWEHVVIANFRGSGDHDLLLQATNTRGYRMGRFMAAYAVESLLARDDTPLWQRNDYIGCAHNGARVADLDGDGRDEVLGVSMLGPDGDVLLRIKLRGHADAVCAADVLPARDGLEMVLLEEGYLNSISLAAHDMLIWSKHHKKQEPQNMAVGRFIAADANMQIWCRGRQRQDQHPFVFDAHGKMVAHYALNNGAPADWTVSGVEVIRAIHWTGAEQMLACAMERHCAGDVCLFNPLTGRFLLHLPDVADRLYVADILGDWREEIVVWNDDKLHIYTNPRPNPRPDVPRLWKQSHYRRSKTTWNYYSP